ncbi:MAG: CD225/dispanin family protein [Planctomycetia bacterium]|nr:CD225/dispanin family protein [Planctomycetia bacterium]
MFCGHCGKQIDDSARFCPFCSAPVDAQTSATSATKPLPSYLIRNILATFCCCSPLALVGVGFSIAAKSAYAAGRANDGAARATVAKCLFWITILFSLLALLVAAFFSFAIAALHRPFENMCRESSCMIQRSAEDFSKEIETALDSFVKTYGIEDRLETKIVLEAQEDGSVKKEIYVNGKKLVLQEFPADYDAVPIDVAPDEIQYEFLDSDAPVDASATADENAAVDATPADSAPDAPVDAPAPVDETPDAASDAPVDAPASADETDAAADATLDDAAPEGEEGADA